MAQSCKNPFGFFVIQLLTVVNDIIDRRFVQFDQYIHKIATLFSYAHDRLLPFVLNCVKNGKTNFQQKIARSHNRTKKNQNNNFRTELNNRIYPQNGLHIRVESSKTIVPMRVTGKIKDRTHYRTDSLILLFIIITFVISRQSTRIKILVCCPIEHYTTHTHKHTLHSNVYI